MIFDPQPLLHNGVQSSKNGIEDNYSHQQIKKSGIESSLYTVVILFTPLQHRGSRCTIPL